MNPGFLVEIVFGPWVAGVPETIPGLGGTLELGTRPGLGGILELGAAVVDGAIPNPVVFP